MRRALIPSCNAEERDQPQEGRRGERRESMDECHRRMWGNVSIQVKSESGQNSPEVDRITKKVAASGWVGKTTNGPERTFWGDGNIPY